MSVRPFKHADLLLLRRQICVWYNYSIHLIFRILIPITIRYNVLIEEHFYDHVIKMKVCPVFEQFCNNFTYNFVQFWHSTTSNVHLSYLCFYICCYPLLHFIHYVKIPDIKAFMWPFCCKMLRIKIDLSIGLLLFHINCNKNTSYINIF